MRLLTYLLTYTVGLVRIKPAISPKRLTIKQKLLLTAYKVVYGLLIAAKMYEQVQKRCLKLLYPSIWYCDILRISSLDRLDYRRDMITQKVFSKIKDPKHPLHDILPPVKVSHSQTTCIKYRFVKIQDMDEILCCTVFLRSFNVLVCLESTD